MNADEIVEHHVDGNRMSLVFGLGEGVRQTGKAAIAHSRREVGPFNVGRADMLRIGAAFDGFLLGAHARRRAVAATRRARIAINLDQHRIVDICAERAFYSLKVRLMTIARQLHPVGQAKRKIADELKRRVTDTFPSIERQDQFRIRVDCHPRPYIAGIGRSGLAVGPFLALA